MFGSCPVVSQQASTTASGGAGTPDGRDAGQRRPHQWQCDAARRGRSSEEAASLAIASEPGDSKSSDSGSGEP